MDQPIQLEIKKPIKLNLNYNLQKKQEQQKAPEHYSVYFLFLIPLFLLFFIGIIGPWYHECDIKDCSYQRDYGLYCEDYCVYGNYGVGSSTVLILIVLVGIIYCWISK